MSDTVTPPCAIPMIPRSFVTFASGSDLSVADSAQERAVRDTTLVRVRIPVRGKLHGDPTLVADLVQRAHHLRPVDALRALTQDAVLAERPILQVDVRDPRAVPPDLGEVVLVHEGRNADV